MAPTSESIATPSLTPKEAAARLHVSAATVRRWLARGELAGVRVGGRLRVEPAALETLIRSAARGSED